MNEIPAFAGMTKTNIMLDYIIKVLLFQTLFLVVYDFLLKKETFFGWNRAYLILTSLSAYIIPLVKFEEVQEMLTQDFILLPEVVLSPTAIIKQQVAHSSVVFNGLEWFFWIGFGIATLLFTIKLTKLLMLISTNRKEWKQHYWLVLLAHNKAFSFFNYIFLNENISDLAKEQIVEHELVHVRQKHSLDLLFFELQRIVCWFNPYSYIYQSRITELHEFIADAIAIKENNKIVYFNKLLAQTFEVNHISFINPFLKKSLLKKRIMMIQRNKSKQVLKLKYVLLIPVLVSMLIYTSCEKSSSNGLQKNEKRKKTLYMKIRGEDKIKVIKSEKESYFDMYMFGAVPDGKEITYSELTDEEKQDYAKIANSGKDAKYHTFKIFVMNDGKKVLMDNIDWKNMKESWASKDYSNASVVPIAFIEKTPIFPGCEDDIDSRKCLQNKIAEHINHNFDMDILKGLDLDADYKRIYVQFVIDKKGMITEIRSRAPHKLLEKEAIRVIQSLPQMKPGEHNGRKVAVKYTLPINLK